MHGLLGSETCLCRFGLLEASPPMALFRAGQGMTFMLCCRIPQRHLVFSFVQHNDGFLHILRVRAIRCGSKSCGRHSSTFVAW